MPLPSTMTPIATTTLGSANSTITFSSISASYTDLVLVINAFATSSTDYIQIRINSDTGTNYSNTAVYGDGTSALSSRVSNQTFGYLSWTQNIAANGRIVIASFQNYSNTTTYKTWLNRSSDAAYGTDAIVGLWRSTSAITTLEIKRTSGGNFNSGSTFTLYGIKAA